MPADPDLLKVVPFFQTLWDDERTAIALLMEEVSIPAGTVMFREHEPGGVLYVLRQGRVELSICNEDGKKIVVHVMEPGDFFGEISLLDGGNRSTTALALQNVEAFSLARDPFVELLRRRADVTLDVVAALAMRMRKTDDLLRARVRNPNEVAEEQETFGNRVSDAVARFGGSWSFIFAFGSALATWVLINTLVIIHRTLDGQTFDPYPFILLNLFLSMLAAVQAPVIMMSQNRQDAKDRIRSELDYQVNLKAELEIMQLHEKVDALRRDIFARLEASPQKGDDH